MRVHLSDTKMFDKADIDAYKAKQKKDKAKRELKRLEKMEQVVLPPKNVILETSKPQEPEKETMLYSILWGLAQVAIVFGILFLPGFCPPWLRIFTIIMVGPFLVMLILGSLGAVIGAIMDAFNTDS